MRTQFWQKLDLWARAMVPSGIGLMFVFLVVLPIPIPGYAVITPMLVLASVFFWAIHSPRFLPPVAVFLIGLVQDSLTGALMGTGTVVLLLVYGVVASQRRFFHHKSFGLVWWGFMLVAGGASVLNWAIASLLGGMVISPKAALFQFLLTLAVYPLVTSVLHLAHRVMPSEDWHDT